MGSFYDLLKQRRIVRTTRASRRRARRSNASVATVRRAPNAGYRQGQRLLVVDDPEILARSRRSGTTKPTSASRAVVRDGRRARLRPDARAGLPRPLHQPDDKLAVTGGSEIVWPVPFWHVDAGAALMLVLARRDRGGPRGGRLRRPGRGRRTRARAPGNPGRPHDRHRHQHRPPASGSRLELENESSLAAPPHGR